MNGLLIGSCEAAGSPGRTHVFDASSVAIGHRSATTVAPEAVDSASMRYQFVDCRWELGSKDWGRAQYLAGHVPGASFLDVETDLSDTSIEGQGRHPVPSSARFADAAGRAGIGEGVFVIAYGTMGGAERLWWLLRHFGHDDCAVLDLASWRGPLRASAEVIAPLVFSPRERTDDVITADDLAARVASPERSRGLVLVDARAPSRYRGEPNPVDRPPGRIPGALNAPWSEPPRDLPAGELVAYCGSGVTACVVLHRAHLAGRPGKLYLGSYSDWSKRGLPTDSG
jgi:thiosulfate/3-mercaptopyruvate sulfurtransferase